MQGWRFEVIRDWDEVWAPEFLAQWRGSIAEAPDAHVFSEPALVKAWTDCYRCLRDIEPRFVVGRTDSETVAFLPLVLDRGRWKDGWVRALQAVGHNEFDYHDPIFTFELAGEELLGFWQGLSDILAVSEPEYDVFGLPRVRARCGCAELGFRFAERAPYIDLTQYASYEDLLRGRAANFRQGLRRKDRRLRELGEVRLRVFESSEAAAAVEALDGFRKSHGARWPFAYRAPGLLEGIAKQSLAEGLLHFSVLELDGRPLSWHLGFVHQKTFYWYMPAYDSASEELSPGRVHLGLLVKEAFARGLEIFDFLRGEERYKSEWTDSRIELRGLTRKTPGLAPSIRLEGRAFLQRARGFLRAGRS